MLRINDVPLDDTFAEAFGMTAVRLIVTAVTAEWATIAATEAAGYASSVIGCDAEIGIERAIPPEETPDGRPGVSLLMFAFSRDALQKSVVNRIGQCILTCPTTACYNGLDGPKDRAIRIGGSRCGFGLEAEEPLFELTDAGLQVSVFACEILFAGFGAFEGVAVIAEVAMGVVVGKKARADGTRLRRQGSGGGRGSLQRAWRRLPRRRFIGRRITSR